MARLSMSAGCILILMVAGSTADQTACDDDTCPTELPAAAQQGKQLLQTQRNVDQQRAPDNSDGDGDAPNAVQKQIRDVKNALGESLDKIDAMASTDPLGSAETQQQLKSVAGKIDALANAVPPDTSARFDRLEKKIDDLAGKIDTNGPSTPPGEPSTGPNPPPGQPSPTAKPPKPSKPPTPSPTSKPPTPSPTSKPKTPSPTSKPKTPEGSGSGTEGKVPVTLKERWINAHNYWRCIHNTGPVTYDEDIAKGAQEWVDAGNTGHADCYDLPNPIGPTGENLAGGTTMGPEKACAMWHDENPEKGPDCGGHCTAMLWKSADRLGCGLKEGTGREMTRVICRYGGGQPLSKRLAANFGSSRAYQANVMFPDNSKAAECKEKWPPAEGEDHVETSGSGGNGGGGNGGWGGWGGGNGGWGGWR